MTDTDRKAGLGWAGPACSAVPAAWTLSTDWGGRYIIYSRTRVQAPASLTWPCSRQPYTRTQDFAHSCGLITCETEAGGSAAQIHL